MLANRLIRYLLTCLACCMGCSVIASSLVVKQGMSIAGTLKLAKAGDTLLIQKGIYKEHDLFIKKRVVIIGKDYPVIDGEFKFQMLVIQADGVVVQGLQIQNSGKSSMNDIAAIRVENAGNVILWNNKIVNNTYGIMLQNAHDCSVLGNVIWSASVDELNGGNGIHAWKCEHLLISGNSISGHRDGIYFEFVTESVIAGNLSTKNLRYGLHFMFSHNDTYTQNIFRNNGSGVAVMYSKGVVMFDNDFDHNWGDASYGLLLKEISDSRIEHNRFTKNTVGIHFEGTNRISIKHCLFQDNGCALHVQASCNGNVFEENNFLSNSFDVATNGTLSLNTFKMNYWDKYDGYDLNKDHIGDVPYYPVSVYSVITQKIPVSMILYRSFLTEIMDQVERIIPTIIPDQWKDSSPVMKKIVL